MARYATCSRCGCSLDFGEVCDCVQEREERQNYFQKLTEVEKHTGQLKFNFLDMEVSAYERKNAI